MRLQTVTIVSAYCPTTKRDQADERLTIVSLGVPKVMIKRNHKFSNAIINRWIVVSLLGLAISAASWAGGEFALAHIRRTRQWRAMTLRVIAAAASGFGMGLTLVFVITLTAGLLYLILRPRCD
jgi:hypothetical protein